MTRKQQLLTRYLNYGKHPGNEFHYNNNLRTLSVSYYCELKHSTTSHVVTVRGRADHSSSSSSSSADARQPLTVVHFQCNPNLSASFIQHERLGLQEPLHIWVESPCACPNGCAVGDLGLGTIFLILLSLSAATYFLLGSLDSLRKYQ